MYEQTTDTIASNTLLIVTDSAKKRHYLKYMVQKFNLTWKWRNKNQMGEQTICKIVLYDV